MVANAILRFAVVGLFLAVWRSARGHHT
jgi:hypothetical protein